MRGGSGLHGTGQLLDGFRSHGRVHLDACVHRNRFAVAKVRYAAAHELLVRNLQASALRPGLLVQATLVYPFLM